MSLLFQSTDTSAQTRVIWGIVTDGKHDRGSSKLSSKWPVQSVWINKPLIFPMCYACLVKFLQKCHFLNTLVLVLSFCTVLVCTCFWVKLWSVSVAFFSRATVGRGLGSDGSSWIPPRSLPSASSGTLTSQTSQRTSSDRWGLLLIFLRWVKILCQFYALQFFFWLFYSYFMAVCVEFQLETRQSDWKLSIKRKCLRAWADWSK